MKKIILTMVIFLFWFNWNHVYAWTFDGFTSWNHSLNKNNTDYTYDILYSIPRTTYYEFGKQVQRGHRFMDINWDWLVDVLYGSQEGVYYKMVIYYNKWNYNFWIWYKCVQSFVTEPKWYYWDCAE